MDREDLKQQAEQIVEKIRELAQGGSVARVLLMRQGEILVNLPMAAGVIGALVGLTAAPFAVLTAALVSFGLDCEIVIEKKDGTVFSLNETEVGTKLEDMKGVVKDKAKDMFGKKE